MKMRTVLVLIFQLLVAVSFTSNVYAKKLSDYIPETKGFELLENLNVEFANKTKDKITVTGFLNNKQINVVQVFGKKDASFYVQPTIGEKLKLSDIIKEMQDLPGVETFSLQKISFHETQLVLTADLGAGETDILFSCDLKKGIVSLNLAEEGSKLSLGALAPMFKDVPVVNAFSFTELNYDLKKKKLSATGDLNAAEATLSIDTSKGVKNLVVDLAATQKKITLGEVVPELKDVPVVNDFSFVDLKYEMGIKTLSGTGSLNDAEMTLTIDTSKGTKNLGIDLSATKQAIRLGDAIPILKNIPGISDFSFKEFSLKDKTISADVAFNNAVADLSLTFKSYKDTLKNMVLVITPRGSKIELDTLFPDLAALPGIKDFKLSGLKYDEEVKKLISKLKIGSYSATLTLDTEGADKNTGANGTRIFKLTSPDLSLGSIVSSLKGVPVLDTLKFTELEISKSFIEADIKIEGFTVSLVENMAKGFAALDFGALDAASFIPNLKDTVINDLKLTSSLFVVSKSDKKLAATDFPPDKQAGLSGVNFGKPFKAGVNLAGSIAKDGLGKLGAVLKKLDMLKDNFPISGFMPQKVFTLMVHHSKNKGKPQNPPKDINVPDFIKDVTLSLDVPLPEIPGVKKFVIFDDALISISGDLGDGSLWNKVPDSMKALKPTEGQIDVSLQGGMKLTIGKFNEDLQMLANLNVGEKDASFSLLGLAKGAWDNPFGVKGLSLKDGGFDIKLGGDNNKKKLDLSLFGTARLHGLDNVAISANFEESGGLPKLLSFEIEGPIALSDFGHKLPHDGNIILHKILLYPTGIEADAEIKAAGFDDRNKLFLFEIAAANGSTFVAAIDVNTDVSTGSRSNFSLGKLGKIAGLKGKNADTIQTHLNGMAVANAALVLSSKKIFPVAPDSLHDGVAKDMFSAIFGKSQIPVKIDNVTFISDFRADLMGDVGDKLVNGVKGLKLGVSEDAIINGTIGGLFDSDPLNLDLEFLLGSSFSIANLKKNGLTLPKALKLNPDKVGAGEKAGVFLKIDGETVEIGLLSGYDATIDKTTFDFTGTLGVQLAEEEVGLSLTGSMSDSWHNALGIKGFELENVTVSGEIEADPPSIKFGMGGETTIRGRDFTMAGDAIVGLLGEFPVPEGIGFKTSTNDLDQEAYKIINTAFIVGDVVFASGNVELLPVYIAGGAMVEALSVAGLAIYDGVTLKKEKLKDRFKDEIESGPKNVMWAVQEFAKLESWLVGGKDLYFSFATPGASDANLGIADGVHLGGKIEVLGGLIKSPTLQIEIEWLYKIIQTLSKDKQKAKKFLTAAATPAGGMQAGASGAQDLPIEFLRDIRKILAYELGLSKEAPGFSYPRPSKADVEAFTAGFGFTAKGFKLGGLDFQGADVSLIPFKIKSRAKVFGVEEDVELAIINGSLAMAVKTKLASIGESTMVLEYDQAKDDFTVLGEFDANSSLQDWMANEIQAGIKQISSSATSKFNALNNDLDKAKKIKAAAEADLNKAQKAVRKVTQNVINHLQSTTNQYQHDYEYAQNKYNHCSGWKKYYCKSKWWPRKGLAYDAWQQSKGLLVDAKKALAEEKDLAVEIHAAQIKFNKAANAVALVLKDVEAAAEIKDAIALGLDKFAQNAKQMSGLFKLEKAYLAGSLKDFENGMPLVLETYFILNGKKYKEFFALSPTDAAFNALAFGLLPVIAAEHIVQDLEKTLEKELSNTLGQNVGNVAGKLNTWIQAHIYELIGGLRDGLEKKIAHIQYELTQEESRYKKIFDSLEAHAGNFLAGYQDLSDEANQILTTYQMSDFMPVSNQFKKSYLAVGHSALCLGVASNGVDVYQQNCKDTDTEQWTTFPLDNGYVQLKSKGLCLKARNADKQSGQPLILSQCNSKDDHEKWKMVSQDGFYDKAVNRYSQKCLHFDTENANPKASYSVWTSCFGSDSQAFRAITDAEKPQFYLVEAMIKAGNGACLATDDQFENYFTKTKKGHTTSTRDDLLKMKRSKDDSLYTVSCDGSRNDRFNYVEMVNGDMKLVHADSGWCVVPGPSHTKSLALSPCDNDKDMYWRTQNRDGQSFELLNIESKQCLDLEQASGQGSGPVAAKLSQCQNAASQSVDFVKK